MLVLHDRDAFLLVGHDFHDLLETLLRVADVLLGHRLQRTNDRMRTARAHLSTHFDEVRHVRIRTVDS